MHIRTTRPGRRPEFCFLRRVSQPAEYRLFGVFDFVFLVPEAILLTMALKNVLAGDQRLESSTAS